jgi:hypothetical protein
LMVGKERFLRLIKNLSIGIHPYSSLPAIVQASERNVHDALSAALPVGWSSWHSLKIRTKPGQFAEGDFVIADPDRGILVLEVKGGNVCKRDGVWLQNGQPMKTGPLDQAHRFVKVLLGKFEERKITAPLIGVAVAFPDTEFENQPSQGDLEGLVLGARELPYMEEALPRLFERALPKNIWRTASPGWIEFIHSLWCESWPAAMSLSCVVKDREAKRVRLDGEQFTALESILENDLVLVRGGAGTGKTLLAWELARREAKAGRKVLVLTFTEALGLELAERVDGSSIAVSPVGRFALDKLRKSGFEEPEHYEPEFWYRVTRLAAESGTLLEGCGFDTVIVDEGQDFGEHEWEIVSRCAGTGERRRIWVFADECQAFWENRKILQTIEKEAFKYNLRRPYRCPPGIQALAEAYVAGSWGNGTAGLESVARELADDTIKVVVCGDTEAEAHGAVGREIRAVKKKGFSESDIAVVSLRGMMYPGNIMHNETLGRCELALATDLARRNRVICDTFLRYKGLERPIIIIADVKTEAERYPIRMNIAVSRAFGALRVVASRREVERDPILGRVAEIAEVKA